MHAIILNFSLFLVFLFRSHYRVLAQGPTIALGLQ